MTDKPVRTPWDGEPVTDKPVRTPWDGEPFVDQRAATEKAIAAARAPQPDPKSAVVQKYAREGFDREIAKIRNAPGPTPGGGKGKRQDTLFPAACAVYELVAAGALDETEVYNALQDACRVNRLEQDDGEKSVEDTLKNARRKGFDNPRDLSRVGTKASTNSIIIGEEKIVVVELDEIQTLERGFWTQRKSLQQIYLAALSGMCAPWAVLGYCAGLALAQVRPSYVLPPLVGGRSGGSLNWFGALTAKSGGGKDAAMGIAEDLIDQDVMVRNLGSGEGLIDQYVKPKDPETGEPQGLHESIMFVETEIDSMAVLSERSGATLSSTLRKAFTGTTIGFSYRTASKQHLLKHSYRLTLMVGIQPAKAGALMDDSYGGSLQRFMWFPASDGRITSEPPPFPGKLELPSSAAWQYPRVLQVPYEAIELIRDERVRDNRGQVDPEDSHAMFIREKFAFALAVLDGRDTMDISDWNLAGTAMRISDHTRKWVKFEMLRIQEEQFTEQGRLHGVKTVASDEERAYKTTQRMNRIANNAYKKIKESGPEGIKNRALAQWAGRDSAYLPAALEKLEHAELVKHIKEGRSNLWTIA